MKLRSILWAALLASTGAFALTLPVPALAQASAGESDQGDGSEQDTQPAIPLNQGSDC